jgi:predicted Ser/Thr protein kinase
MELFARGKRGVIYRDGNICVKEKNPASAVDTLENEAEFLKILNKKNIGPKFISYENGRLRREFVDGKHLGKFLAAEDDPKKILSVLKQVLLQCHEMDLLGINKTELTNPYKDIIVDVKNHAVLIDFERCKKTAKPKNVTQFIQYISQNAPGLSKKEILVDKNEMIALGKEYKSSPSEKSFRRILQVLS